MSVNPRKTLSADIVKQIMSDEPCFSMAYQPKVFLLSAIVCGFEALLRWKPSNDQDIIPQQVIDLADYAGPRVSIRLLQRILTKVIKDISRVPLEKRLPVAVNVTPEQLTTEIAEFILGVAAENAVDHRLIEIEVTEHKPLGCIDDFSKRASAVKSLGFDVWLDDFGVGYSALSTISKTPLYGVKLDRSFIASFQNRSGLMLMNSVVDLCRHQGLKVVIEGIEDKSDHLAARSTGASYAQGYFYGKPLDSKMNFELLDEDFLI